MHPEMRASDADRERAADALRRHSTEGRITLEELEERLGLVYAARTIGQIGEAMHDLPPLLPAPPDPPRRRRNLMVDQVAAYVAGNLFLILVWVGTGAGYFWPGWIIFWWGFALVVLAARRQRRPR